ncbi:hypothetical protein AWC38_SpisGene23431 [Stylophora pistillata]|uniref:Uncharacterized protein n=1 Tax=Stylophora pistillata TaxID=50429 RepID=A0A2B4R6Z3_STYPI|nr:hypothetical protein AWC38_SpisGene23431 [Stylophora pistillata]
MVANKRRYNIFCALYERQTQENVRFSCILHTFNFQSQLGVVSEDSRGECFFAKESSVEISPELLDLTSRAFAKPLEKDKWKELISSYPCIKGTDSFLVAPTMEAGMKEELRKSHGHTKIKKTLAFGDGLAEKQATIISVARPILAALEALDDKTESDDGSEGIDPDTVEGMLEDALVMLGNANARLNEWRERRLLTFMTEIVKRTMREGIPTD